MLTFLRNLLPPPSQQKILTMEPERAGSSKMLVTIYQATPFSAKEIQAARTSVMFAATYNYTVSLPEDCILNIHFLFQKNKICFAVFYFHHGPNFWRWSLYV
jgi:hypothetical protein